MIGLVWLCTVGFALDEAKAYTGDKINPPLCATRWTEVNDVYSLGSTFRHEITSVEACMEACINRLQGCVAVDVHGHFPHCFTHNQPLDKVEKNRKTYDGYTQLILTKECPSTTLTPTTTISEDTLQSFTKTDGSQAQSFTETVENKPQIFTETAASQLQSVDDGSKPQSFTGTVESRPQSFTDGSEAKSATDGNKPQSFTGTFENKPQIFTEIDEECLSSTPTPRTGTAEISPAGILTSTTRTVEKSPTGLTTGIAKTFPIASSYVSGGTTSPAEPEADCIDLSDDWEEYVDTFTSKARLFSRVDGAEACKRACVEEISGCVAVEYHVPGNCWYHDRDIDFGKYRRRRKDFVLYVRIGGDCEKSKLVQQPSALLQLQLALFG